MSLSVISSLDEVFVLHVNVGECSMLFSYCQRAFTNFSCCICLCLHICLGVTVMWSETLVLLQDQSQTNRIRSWSWSCELWSWSWFWSCELWSWSWSWSCSTGLGLGLYLGGLFMRPYRARLGDKTLRDLVMPKCNKRYI